MNPWAALLGTLAYNYRCHRRGKPTICATTRRLLPQRLAAGALCVGFAFLFHHVIRGYPRP